MKLTKNIKLWQIHTITDDQDLIFKAKTERPDIKIDKIIVLTGTLIDDPTGKFSPGEHTRTSVVIDKYEEDGKTIYETGNTKYKVHGPMGDTTIGGGDWGYNVMRIFY